MFEKFRPPSSFGSMNLLRAIQGRFPAQINFMKADFSGIRESSNFHAEYVIWFLATLTFTISPKSFTPPMEGPIGRASLLIILILYPEN